MTVEELINELQRFEGERKVYVAVDRLKAAPLLGVIGDGYKVILDPSANEDEWESHEAGSWSMTGRSQ